MLASKRSDHLTVPLCVAWHLLMCLPVFEVVVNMNFIKPYICVSGY